MWYGGWRFVKLLIVLMLRCDLFFHRLGRDWTHVDSTTFAISKQESPPPPLVVPFPGQELNNIVSVLDVLVNEKKNDFIFWVYSFIFMFLFRIFYFILFFKLVFRSHFIFQYFCLVCFFQFCYRCVRGTACLPTASKRKQSCKSCWDCCPSRKGG